MVKMLKVYPASKIKHAPTFRSYNKVQSKVVFFARWLHHNEHGTEDSAINATEFWLQDEFDVKHSDAVLVYAKPEDKLHGALVEAGIAIGYGIPVVVVGNHPDYSTWQFHPGVHSVDTLDDAIKFLSTLIVPRYKTMQRAR